MWKQLRASYANFNEKWPTLPFVYRFGFVAAVIGLAALVARAF